MTQLSKALTAETPEERLSVIADAVTRLKLCGGSTPEVDMIIREAMLNERTLFIAACRGDIKTTNDPMTAGPLSPTTTPTPAPPEAQKPMTPDMPGWQPALGATVEELIRYKAVDSEYRMPLPVFQMWRDLKKGTYPTGLSERRKALEALTPSERGWLLKAIL